MNASICLEINHLLFVVTAPHFQHMKTIRQLGLPIIASLAVIVLFAGCNAIQRTGSTNEQTDDAISATLKASFAQDHSLRWETITIVTSDGVVTLNGNVANPNERDRAGAIARSTPGVQAVNDNLSVK
jgi:hyperosmotically inducible periplasmic protein